MRTVYVAIALAIGLAVAGSAPAVASDVSSSTVSAASSVEVAATAQPDLGNIKVDIDLDRHEWYEDPVWMAIGGLAVLLVAVLIVLAMRGGGTRLVKH